MRLAATLVSVLVPVISVGAFLAVFCFDAGAFGGVTGAAVLDCGAGGVGAAYCVGAYGAALVSATGAASTLGGAGVADLAGAEPALASVSMEKKSAPTLTVSPS